MRSLQFLFDFRGRFSRTQFWLVILIYAAYIGSVFGLIMIATGAEYYFLAAWAPGAIAVLAATVKRLHDRNRSAAWLFGYFLANFITLAVAATLMVAKESGNLSTPWFNVAIFSLVIVCGVIVWWGFIDVGFLRGTTGDNRFGPDPLAKPASVPAEAMR
jgi:uncharacterized membrane protein YhaH (DUF805 family)